MFIGRSDVYIPFPAKIREAKEYVLEHNLMDEDTRKKLCGRAYTTLLQDFEN